MEPTRSSPPPNKVSLTLLIGELSGTKNSDNALTGLYGGVRKRTGIPQENQALGARLIRINRGGKRSAKLAAFVPGLYVAWPKRDR
jgi:hypothetical protein